MKHLIGLVIAIVFMGCGGEGTSSATTSNDEPKTVIITDNEEVIYIGDSTDVNVTVYESSITGSNGGSCDINLANYETLSVAYCDRTMSDSECEDVICEELGL